MKKTIKRLFHDSHGAVTMEQVMLGALIAASCLVIVIVLSRSLLRSSDVSSKALTGKGSENVAVSADTYREDAKKESIIAKLYHLFITGEDD